LGWAVAIYFGVSVTMDAVRTFILIKDHIKTRTTS
jgi:hypothetical protein